MENQELKTKFIGLSEYYVKEFEKIHESSETYKGKFNWTAFFFGPFWSLIKGLWLAAVVWLIVGIVTAGIGMVVYWVIFGFRGNYILYNYLVKGKQIPL